MSESRTVNLLNGITARDIGEHLVAWFQQSEGMEAQGTPTANGYGIQARSHEDGWKTISGTSQALQVQILDMGTQAVVQCAYGKWSDKVGAGVVGWFIFAPLAVTAIVGSVKQKKLPEKVYAEVERFIMSGGNSVYTSVGRSLEAGEVVCNSCGKVNKGDSEFCSGCGQPLGYKCPGCGSNVDRTDAFCPRCGTQVVIQQTVTTQVSAATPQAQAVQIPVGESIVAVQEPVVDNTPAVLSCPQCGTTIQDGQKFCMECGHKLI